MTARDPALCARLVASARVHCEPHPMELSPSAEEKLISDLADQLEAADREVQEHEAERLRMRDNIEELQVERDALRASIREMERQRDCHRSTLNRFANRLRVVHEDPKISDAVNGALDDRDVLRAEVARLRAGHAAVAKIVSAAGSLRDMRLTVDSRLKQAERRMLDLLSEAVDAYRDATTAAGKEAP